MRTYRITLKENKKKMLFEITNFFRTEQFKISQDLFNKIQTDYRPIFDRVFNEDEATSYKAGYPSESDAESQYVRFGDLISSLNSNKYVQDIAGSDASGGSLTAQPFISLLIKQNNRSKYFFQALGNTVDLGSITEATAPSAPAAAAPAAAPASGGTSSRGSKTIQELLKQMYRASIISYMLDSKYDAKREAVDRHYITTLANVNNKLAELSKEIKGSTTAGKWEAFKGFFTSASKEQAKGIVAAAIEAANYFINTTIDFKIEADRYSKAYVEGRLVPEGATAPAPSASAGAAGGAAPAPTTPSGATPTPSTAPSPSGTGGPAPTPATPAGAAPASGRPTVRSRTIQNRLNMITNPRLKQQVLNSISQLMRDAGVKITERQILTKIDGLILEHQKKNNLLKEYREHIETKLVPYMQKQIGFNRPPVINFLDDAQNAADPMGKTAFYDPQSMEISVYTTGRHPKDIMRSVAHEVIHHAQNCRGQLDPQRMGEASEGYAQRNPYLRKLEEEAYLLGNMTFRDWEDGMKSNQLNEAHDCNKVHPNKSHAAYKRDDEAKEEKSLEEWKNEERWDLLMKRFKIVSEKRFANDPKLDKDGDGKPKWADEDDNNPEEESKKEKK